ncbi:response regulator [Nitrospina watsonii]|uniref:Response regulatory domain-containing protein n=1 Tax=Nitrospina watsonii TaxID=1323948 RepID=A0ABM9HAG4_9BACT|nr:response regulator [Nitrospina watsonii]CAI2717121.1 protein of unknown function [Nitrospina watsonii]
MDILLIDQESEVLDLLENLIRFASPEGNGWSIQKTNKPEDAVQLALQNGFDLVVMDPRFSEKWGLPLIKTIREVRPRTTVIVLCNCGSDLCSLYCRDRYREFGVNHHVDKTKGLLGIPGMVRDCQRNAAVC